MTRVDLAAWLYQVGFKLNSDDDTSSQLWFWYPHFRGVGPGGASILVRLYGADMWRQVTVFRRRPDGVSWDELWERRFDPGLDYAPLKDAVERALVVYDSVAEGRGVPEGLRGFGAARRESELWPGFRNRMTGEVRESESGTHFHPEGLPDEWEDGFVTKKGEFLSRAEAARYTMPTAEIRRRARDLNIDTEELESLDYETGVDKGIFGAVMSPPPGARWPQGLSTATFDVAQDGAQVNGHPVEWMTIAAWGRGGPGGSLQAGLYRQRGHGYLTAQWKTTWFNETGMVDMETLREYPGRFRVHQGSAYPPSYRGERDFDVALHPDEADLFAVWLDKLEEHGIIK